MILAALSVYVTFGGSRQFAQERPTVKQSRIPAKFVGTDQITDDIRSDSKDIVRLRVSDSRDREKAERYGRIVGDYDSFVILTKTKGSDISQSGLEVQNVETSVHLPGANFEPLAAPPSGSLRLGRSATSNGKGYYVIQFGATVKDEWLDSLDQAGVEVLQYVPNQAYLVYGESEAIEKAADHSRVRWMGSYTADQKVSGVVRDQIAFARKQATLRSGLTPLEVSKNETAVFDVAVFARADVEAVAAQLRNSFAPSFLRTSRLQHNFFNVVRVELPLDRVDEVAAIPDVFSVDGYVKPTREDERSSQVLAGNYSSTTSISGPGYDPLTQFGADGTNVTVAVADDGVGIPGDGGFYITAANAKNGPLRGALAGAQGHGHLNASIIAGRAPFSILDGSGYNYGLGVAPKANIINIPMLRQGYTGTDADFYNDSITTPGPNGVHPFLSNNSWGDGLNGNAYGALEAQYDGFVRDASIDASVDPMCLVFSAGNSGASGLTRPKMAKNIIAVGNSESLRPELAGTAANNIDDLSSTSSRGPAADGRIKPDISAPGSGISGGRSGTDSLFGNIDSNHRWSSGTSHAAPQITGMAALFTHYWSLTRSGDKPSPALIKAAVINTGQDMNGSLTTNPIPNGNEGWGRANLKLMLNTGVGMNYVDEDVTLSNTGSVTQFTGSVADSSKPVRVTLVWTDPPGVADPALVNNLDLTVTVGGTAYKGNVFSNGVSVTGGTSDNRNNVESVILPAGIPIGTAFSVSVTATALNGDGVLENGDFTDQNYAVVAFNYSPLVGPSFFSLVGQAKSPSGRGVPLAAVRLISPQGQVRETITNQMGFFRFTNIAGGQSHTVAITHKRYNFVNQSISLSSNLVDVFFVASNGNP